MKLIKDYYVNSAYDFFKPPKTDEQIEDMIEDAGSDQDLINNTLNKKYPADKYFVLVDYFERESDFRIRIWKLETSKKVKKK